MIRSLGLLVLAACMVLAYGIFGKAQKSSEIVEDCKQDEAVVAEGVAYLEPAYLDLGEAFWGTEHEFCLELINNSQVPVVITGVKTSCGCSTSTDDYLGSEIAPHSSLPMFFSMRLGGRVGSVSTSVTVQLESGEELSSRAAMQSLSTYQLSADVLDFEDIDILDSGDTVFHQLLTFTSEEVELQDVRVDCDWIEFTRNDSERGVEILCTFLNDKVMLGEMLGSITVSTNDSTRPVSVVRLKATGISSLVVHPSRAFLVRDKSCKLTFYDRSMVPVRIVSVLLNQELFEYRVEENVVYLSSKVPGPRENEHLMVEDEQGRRTIVTIHSF